jgi:hypothetical protein
MTLKGPSEPRYKFRAENEPDMFRYVARVLAMEARAQAEGVTRLADGSGVTCELSTTLSLDHLRDLSRIGGDLHVITETIKPKGDYDGGTDALSH